MFSRLEHVIDNAVAAGRIVGVVYLVARNGEIIFAREHGFADRRQARRSDATRCFASPR